MKIIKLNIILFSLIVIIACSKEEKEIPQTGICKLNSNNQSASHPKKNKYKNILDKYINRGVPGAVVLIQNPLGTWIGAGGYASLETKLPMQSCHIFQCASITKLMVHLVILKMQEEGLLNINDKISKHLPTSLLKDIENANEATILNCMNHTTGIPNVENLREFELDIANEPLTTFTPERLLKYLKNKPADFPVNQQSSYSSSGQVLLALIIERITHKKHSVVVNEKLITPLAMSRSYYGNTENNPWGDKLVQGYSNLYQNNILQNVTNSRKNNANGFTGLYSNVNDLQKMINAVFREKTFLSNAAYQNLETVTSTSEYTIGGFKDFMHLFSDKSYGLGHAGRELGYNSDAYYFPNQKTTLIVASNIGGHFEGNAEQEYQHMLEELIVNF